MKFTVDGVEYLGTEDVAAQLGIAPSTVRSLIKRKILPEVPKQVVGARAKRGFTQEYVDNAKVALAERAARKSK